jgi:uncharacterized cupredoxin-like copper-binding protein
VPGSTHGTLSSEQLSRRRFVQLVAGSATGLLAMPVLAACGVGPGAVGAAGRGGKGEPGFSHDVVEQKVYVAATAVGTLKWDKEVYEAHAGDVTFVVKNPSPVEHRFGIEGNGVNVHSPNCKAGATSMHTLKGLAPGEYLVVCTFPGHREARMVSRLIVTQP